MSAGNPTLATSASSPRRLPRLGVTRKRGSLWADVAGLSPAMVLYGVFIVVPVLFALVLSFTTWNVIGPLRWAGFANWSRFFSDPTAHHSLLVTLELAGASWAVQTPIGMALGLFVAGTQRYRSVFAGLYLLPLLLSTAGIALMWQGVLTPNFGGVAWISIHMHLPLLNQNWLGSARLAFWVLVAVIAWQFIPFHMLLYQAGRRAIPPELYDAARVDGSTPAQAFRYVTVPQLRYTIATSSTLIVVGSLTYFDLIFILTNGGPGDATRVLSLDMYDTGFLSTTFGYASVLAVVLGVIGIAVAIFVIRATGFGSMESGREGIW
ncbi:MAG TPA: sugar ABC transporter permease [Acidimicrobiales bacterium]|nr:sugar ABC transporter permease [Acidimicrobiales bacterium]